MQTRLGGFIASRRSDQAKLFGAPHLQRPQAFIGISACEAYLYPATFLGLYGVDHAAPTVSVSPSTARIPSTNRSTVIRSAVSLR